MAELDIGKHCGAEYCNQLDFLPFTCNGCSEIFCLKHKDPWNHQCIIEKLEQKAKTTKKTNSTAVKYFCTFENCTLSELVPVLCSLCEKQQCLKHRNPEEHKCSKLPEIKKEPRSQLPAWKPKSPKKESKSLKSQKLAAKVALMKLKQSAKGDNSIPENERLYFSVTVNTTKDSSKSLFVSSHWTVGKVLDSFCNQLNLTNTNNTDCDTKIRLCSSATGHVIKPDKNMQDVMSEQLLFNGSSIVVASMPKDCEIMQI